MVSAFHFIFGHTCTQCPSTRVSCFSAGFMGPIGEKGMPGISGTPGMPGFRGDVGQVGHRGLQGTEGASDTVGKLRIRFINPD